MTIEIFPIYMLPSRIRKLNKRRRKIGALRYLRRAIERRLMKFKGTPINEATMSAMKIECESAIESLLNPMYRIEIDLKDSSS